MAAQILIFDWWTKKASPQVIFICLNLHIREIKLPFMQSASGINSVEVPYMMPYIKALGLMVSNKKIFSCFPYTSLCKTCDPLGGAIFGPRGII